MKRILLTEQQFDRLRDVLGESMDEVNRDLSSKELRSITKAQDNVAREIYGKHYGEDVGDQNDYYQIDDDKRIKYDADIKGGLFSFGNAKLSPDTLIINFNSALNCPSINSCPVTQQACYAVAGENRLHGSRRKSLIVQNLVNAAMANDKLGMIFDLARLMVDNAMTTKHKVRYIRYNEVGDFKNQKMLEAAARFSKEVADKYGIMSMAYTANRAIDPSALIDGVPIDQIIKINRSRNDIKKSEGAVDQKFFGIEMPKASFETDPDKVLEDAYCDVMYVSDKDSNRLGIMSPVTDKNGIFSIPRLRLGQWTGGNGWYYVCPCSFWKFNKDKAEEKYLKKIGILQPEEVLPETPQAKTKYYKRMTDAQRKKLNSILDKIESPCGTKCAVCHNMQGGYVCDDNGQPIMDEQGNPEIIKDFTVLTATHGATQSNYNDEYATKLRNGQDAVYSTENPHGKWNAYDNAWREKHGDKRPVMPNMHQMTKDNASV